MTHVHHWIVENPECASGGIVGAVCLKDGCPKRQRTFDVRAGTLTQETFGRSYGVSLTAHDRKVVESFRSMA